MGSETDLAARKGGILWDRLMVGMLLTGFIALSAHVVMLDVLHIPFPSDFPRNGIFAFLNYAARVIALFYFYDLAAPSLKGFSLPAQCLLVFVLYGMLRESLFRLPLMDSVITTAWIYSFTTNIFRLIPILVACCLVVLFAPRLKQAWQKWGLALVLSAFLFFVCQPLVGAGRERASAWLSHLGHEEVYPETSWPVMLAAYVSYIEPVVACFILAKLIWPWLVERPKTRTWQFVLLILLMKGVLFTPFIYIFYAKLAPQMAFLSYGQFTLEEFLLALLTVLTWRASLQPTLSD